MTRKFGRLPKKVHPKTLLFSKYLTEAVPEPPEHVAYEYVIPPQSWGMDANDQVGDCTCACVAHEIMMFTKHTGIMVAPTAQDVLNMYSAITGYNQQTGANDNGAAITDVLAYWQNKGLIGHNIEGWAAIDVSNRKQLMQALWIFGALDLGVNLTQSAMDQFDATQEWGAISGPVVGGHSVPLMGAGRRGGTVVTWGRLQQFDWPWFQVSCDEAYAVITKDWIQQQTQKSISGFDLPTLLSDLKALNQAA